jgi:hypothetical protein
LTSARRREKIAAIPVTAGDGGSMPDSTGDGDNTGRTYDARRQHLLVRRKLEQMRKAMADENIARINHELDALERERGQPRPPRI